MCVSIKKRRGEKGGGRYVRVGEVQKKRIYIYKREREREGKGV